MAGAVTLADKSRLHVQKISLEYSHKKRLHPVIIDSTSKGHYCCDSYMSEKGISIHSNQWEEKNGITLLCFLTKYYAF